MKIYYHPSYNGRVYIDYSSEKHPGGMLFDEVCVSTADLLDQLLLRAGIPQGVAEGSEKRTKAREEAYQQAIDADWINGAKDVDPEGTVQQVLHWRDTLIMAGWTEEMTASAQSRKLRALSEWESRYNRLSHLARADKWRALRDYIKEKGSPLHSDDTIEVMTPKVLLPNLVVEVLEMLGAEWKMEQLDESLNSPESIQVVHVTEQYEGWQQVYNYAKADMIVCSDSVRLNDSMRGIGGAEWKTDNAGCPNVVDSLTDMLDAPKSLVWLDCAGNTSAKYLYDFLTSTEIAELAAAGVKLPTAEDISSATLREQFTLLNRIAKITLIAPERHEGEMLGEHPIVTCIGRKKEEQAQPTALPQTNEEPVRTFEAKDYIQLNHPEMLPNCHTSYSSLSNLFQSPFDYVVGNVLELYAPEDDSETGIKIIMGNVAHKIVELMTKGSSYDAAFTQALDEKGKELQKSENFNTLALFKPIVRSSVDTLFGIIKELGLTIVESEMEIKKPFDIFDNPIGYVDLVLEKDGELIIIDMKYSERDEYPASLTSNTSVQLEYYRHALEAQTGKKVAWMGYYLFPLKTLFTTADIQADGVEVVPVANDATANLWEIIKESYRVRNEEIKAGRVEEAEGMPLENLAYSKKEGVFALSKEKNTNLKAVDYGKYRSQDDDLTKRPSKHTILKNHLK